MDLQSFWFHDRFQLSINRQTWGQFEIWLFEEQMNQWYCMNVLSKVSIHTRNIFQNKKYRYKLQKKIRKVIKENTYDFVSISFL